MWPHRRGNDSDRHAGAPFNLVILYGTWLCFCTYNQQNQYECMYDPLVASRSRTILQLIAEPAAQSTAPCYCWPASRGCSEGAASCPSPAGLGVGVGLG
eukprot:COSAG02_NODE_68_length_42582_cov_52.351129_39_plen_99_part_00